MFIPTQSQVNTVSCHLVHISGSEASLVGCLANPGGNSAQRIAEDRIHPSNFMRLIVFVILQDTKSVDPKIVDP